jgi:sorbitol/mannitol transport system permease protein
MVMTSFKTDADAVNPELYVSMTLENYANMTDTTITALRSIRSSVFATLFALVVGVPCAYSMAFSPPFNQDILVWMLSTRCFHGGCLYPMTFLTKNVLGVLTPTLGHRCLVPDQPTDRGLDAVHLL